MAKERLQRHHINTSDQLYNMSSHGHEEVHQRTRNFNYPEISSDSLDNIQRRPISPGRERPSPHHQRTLSNGQYHTRQPPPPQSYRSSPKPQQPIAPTPPQQRSSSPGHVVSLGHSRTASGSSRQEARQSRPRRERAPTPQHQQQSVIPPISKYTYEPYRANSSVFEESEDELLARKKASKTIKSKSKPISKFNLFSGGGGGGSKKVVEPIVMDMDDEPVKSMYTHKSGSGDSLELMPTIAMGYENSMDKQMRHRQLPGGELRITGNGYYFKADDGIDEFESEEDEVDDEVSAGDSDIHEAYKVNMDYGEANSIGKDHSDQSSRVSSVDNGLQNPVVIQTERGGASRGRVEKLPTTGISRSRSVSRHAMEEVESSPIEETSKKEKSKRGFFKKLVSSSKTKKNKKKDNNNSNMKTKSPPDIMDIYQKELELRKPGSSSPRVTIPESRHGSESGTPRAPYPSSPTRSLQFEQESELEEEVEPSATLADVLGSIPVLSAVFARIDESESLSDQSKLLIKIGVIIWVMYEVQMILEAIGRVFSR